MILPEFLSDVLNSFVGHKAVIDFLNACYLVYAVFVVVTTCRLICIYNVYIL